MQLSLRVRRALDAFGRQSDSCTLRVFGAPWLAEGGEVEQARRLLHWQDAPWLDWPWLLGEALGGPTALVRARLEERRGGTIRAAEYYPKFLRRYDQRCARSFPSSKRRGLLWRGWRASSRSRTFTTTSR